MLKTIDDVSAVRGGTMLYDAGKRFGFGAGVAVTGALRFVPGWNDPVAGRGDGFQKRHEPVVGPKIAGYANGLAPGAWKDFVTGVGAGASEAPQWTFEHGL